jgi:hypothetical protein
MGEGVSSRHPVLMISEYGPPEALDHQVWMTTTHQCRREPPFVNKRRRGWRPLSVMRRGDDVFGVRGA